MPVDRCICHNVPFSRMLELRAQGLTFAQIRAQTGACSSCGLCEPYARLALATNRPALPVLHGRGLERARAVDPDADRA